MIKYKNWFIHYWKPESTTDTIDIVISSRENIENTTSYCMTLFNQTDNIDNLISRCKNYIDTELSI